MTKLAVIGGSGFNRLDSLVVVRREVVRTPFGSPSAPIVHGVFEGKEIAFLPRHGSGHTIPPHKVNYRANLYALKQVGVEYVVGMAAVGGITGRMGPRQLVCPDQIIDYTWGRANTYYESDLSEVVHIDFTEPYCQLLRQALLDAAAEADVDMLDGATYAAMQGPRLETAAEIDRLERDGCDLVGMTGMPEAALARELDICYAHCAIVVNRAAGRGDGPITMDEIQTHLDSGMHSARAMLAKLDI